MKVINFSSIPGGTCMCLEFLKRQKQENGSDGTVMVMLSHKEMCCKWTGIYRWLRCNDKCTIDWVILWLLSALKSFLYKFFCFNMRGLGSGGEGGCSRAEKTPETCRARRCLMGIRCSCCITRSWTHSLTHLGPLLVIMMMMIGISKSWDGDSCFGFSSIWWGMCFS